MGKVPVIPWEKFSEEEIHYIIEDILTWNGWDVYNIHKIQRSEERGADIIATKDNRKIAIAVKKKPKAGDRSQLKDLFNRREDEKIYVYINDPTPIFKEEMEDFSGAINFLSKESFSKWIFELDPEIFTALFTFNHSLIYEFTKMQIFLLILWREWKGAPTKKYKWKKLDEDSLRTLWRLKDDIVFINKTLRSFQLLFERLSERNIDIEASLDILKSFARVLDLLNKRCPSMRDRLRKFYEKNKNYTLYVVGKTNDRSNWLSIASFHPPIHGHIIDDHESKMSKKEDTHISDSDSIIYSLSNFCRVSANFADSVECFVDDLFSYGIWNEYSSYA
ncbi:restriction endonuclease, partial [candidate division WOR-3 bacterium]|nr:restriction endonuclease [candidate division WOR-3 bacterium]